MYNRILVPLDGSKLAECVLPHVESISQGCGAQEIIFLGVVEPAFLPVGVGTDGADTFTDLDAEKIREGIEAGHQRDLKNYLGRLAGKARYGAAKVNKKIIKGNAAEKIADYANKNDVDLIVIATHGRSGISRWVMGSVADRVLRSSCVPVLMVRAPGCAPGI